MNLKHLINWATRFTLNISITITSSIAGIALHSSNVSAGSNFPESLAPLLVALRKSGYEIKLSSPPKRGAYGEIDSIKKVIWIEPITIDLGVVRQTLIHESVHAVQACPNGKLSPVGWDLPMSRVVDLEVSGILYRNYHRQNFEIEREAFAMQGHPDAINLITKELKERCKIKAH